MNNNKAPESNHFLSVITVTYNDRSNLKKTLASLLSQTCQDFEVCVIDGGSTDGTLDLLKSYESLVDKVVSESDFGIYDAMNKGVNISSGKYLIFINAGDEFYDENVIQNIVSRTLDDVVYYTNAEYIRQAGESFIFHSSHEYIYQKMPFNHQSMLFPRGVHEKFLYNTNYRISSDYDLALRLKESGVKFEKLDFIIAKHYLDGISVTSPFLSCLESVHAHLVSRKKIDFRKTEYYGEYFIREVFKNSPLISKLVLALYLVFEKKEVKRFLKTLVGKLIR